MLDETREDVRLQFGFIGHRFHERSLSTRFFIDILNEIGEVESFTADPDDDPSEHDGLILALLGKTFDCLVFLQTEFMAAQLRPLVSCRFVVVAMYDGALGRPDDFWRRLKGSRFLSFCRAHHEHLVELDCDSASFQYFPPPSPMSARETRRRSAFFWERRPDQAINLALILDLCQKLEISDLHVHAAPDFDRLKSNRAHRITQVGDVSVTWSTWFQEREEYEAVAMGSLFFFAPRLREGIGMATLEAMSAGQIVIAPDYPSVNEYISHATTGILYDPEDPKIELTLSEEKLQQMSAASRKRAQIGRLQWLADVERLKSLLLDDGRRWSTGDQSAGFMNDLRAAASQRIFQRATRWSADVVAS